MSQKLYPYKIIQGTHFFQIETRDQKVLISIYNFASDYVEHTFAVENGKTVLKPSKIYAVNYNGNAFRFHIGQLPKLLDRLRREGYPLKEGMLEKLPVPEYESVTMTVSDKYEERDYQTKVIDFLVKEEEGDLHSRLVGLPTGTGKGFCSLKATAILGRRTLVIVLPKYIKKWVDEIQEVLPDVEEEDIVTIRGNAQLRSVLEDASEECLDCKFIVASLTTMQAWYKEYMDEYDHYMDKGYPCYPDELCELLRVGTVIFDEVHQHMYSVFITMTHLNVQKVIALSATFDSDDTFLKNIQHIMFPKEIRYDKVPMDRFREVIAVAYTFGNGINSSNIRTTAYGSNLYSHIAFEKWLLKKKGLLRDYLDMIKDLVDGYFIEECEKGHRCIVYASSINMCNAIRDRLQQAFPDRSIYTYVQGCDYDTAINSDIIVSTLGMSGTALDIPMLRRVFLTISIKSKESNLQVFGRLRKLKDLDTKFIYVYCTQLKKHVQYHRYKKELLGHRSRSYQEVNYPYAITGQTKPGGR